jgi:iron complex outermembrane receptor protein
MKAKKYTLNAAAVAFLASPFAAQVQAQDDSELDSSLEEVVVTAQFIEQDAQQIPIAVTALSGDMLDLRGQTDTALIGAQAPSVQLLRVTR